MNRLFQYTTSRLLQSFRFIEYHFDGLFDPMRFKNCDFSNGAEPYTNIASNGKKYSIFDPEYWDKQWRYWEESKKGGKNYYADVANFVNKSSKGVFEIGCGPGYLIESIHPSIHYKGIDLSREAIIMARKKLKNKNFECYVDTIENMSSYLSNDKFDTFVAIDMLEHLNNDFLNLVVEVITNYKHFKFIYIVTPYLNRVPSRGHIQCFSKSNIKKLLREAYLLKFKPYRNYTEFLIVGQRKT